MTIDQKTVQKTIEENLHQKLISFSLKGQGMCNYVWCAVSEDNQKYSIKQERSEKEEDEQNDLLVEARTLRKLNEKSPSLPVPHVLFITEKPKLYCYQYVEGEIMKNAWRFLSAAEKVSLCEDLGKFHAQLEKTLTLAEMNELKIANNSQAALEKEAEDDLELFLNDTTIPQHYKQLVKRLYEVFNETQSAAYFGLCHNDSHHENILVHQGKLAGVIDFGDADFGDVHREFARYVQDYPQHAEIIIRTYEQQSGQPLCRKRILALTLLETTDDLRTEYSKSGRMEVIERLSPWLAEFVTNQ